MNINDIVNVQLYIGLILLSLDFTSCFVKWDYKQRCKVLPVHCVFVVDTFLCAQTILKFITLSYNDITNLNICLVISAGIWIYLL